MKSLRFRKSEMLVTVLAAWAFITGCGGGSSTNAPVTPPKPLAVALSTNTVVAQQDATAGTNGVTVSGASAPSAVPVTASNLPSGVTSQFAPAAGGLRVSHSRRPKKVSSSTPAKTRVYYIAAEKVIWDYAPHGRNLTGTPSAEIDPDEESPETRSLRTSYVKAIYREYSDATFQNLKPRAPEWQHLGILGPLIRGEVGDTIRVVFRNKTDHLCTMHPHGLAYTKDSEGAIYKDGTTGADKRDDLVPPGGTYTYTWTVPERSGPAPGDPSSILWMYHSHVDEPSDMNTGLLGPIIVSARGSTKPDGTPKDVDREFVLAFAVFDETDSWFFEENAIDTTRYSFAPSSVDPVFRKSNSLYSINGLIEGNVRTMTMKKGERVRWYLFANSNEDDVHTPHWHGQTVICNHMRTDIVHLEPMMMVVADMVPDSLGTWLFHCHVNDHIRGGMQALFSVIP